MKGSTLSWAKNNKIKRLKILNEIRELLTVVHNNKGINKYYYVKRMSGGNKESFFIVVSNINGVISENRVSEEDMPKISLK